MLRFLLNLSNTPLPVEELNDLCAAFLTEFVCYSPTSQRIKWIFKELNEFMDFLYLIFMVAWGFAFWMWRQTLAHGVLYLLSAEYSVVMCGAWPETLVTWSWLRLSMICCCALRLGLRYASRVGGAGSWFRSPCLVVSGQDASGPWEGCIRSRWLRSISPTQIWVWLLRNAGF